MKRLIFVLCCFLLPYCIIAQIKPSTFAKDFTITDLDGNQHNLFEYLDDGKVVLVDIFSTWCPPCWEYVNSGALQKMHKKYGKNNVVVLLIEGDKMSPDDCIVAGPDCKEIMTRGNWKEIVNFPIAGDVGPEIAKLYGVQYFPTVLMFFPNRQVQEVGQIPFKDLVEVKNKKKHYKVKKENNVASLASNLRDLNCGTLNPMFKFQNLGTNNLKSFNIDLYTNGKLIQTKSWVGNAETYEIIDLNLGPISLEHKNELIIKARLPNGEKDRKKKNNLYSKTIWVPTFKQNEIFTFTIRDIGENNSVDIKIIAPDGKSIFELLEQKNQKAGITIDTKDLEMNENGCYTLLIEDTYKKDKTYNENLTVSINCKDFIYITRRDQFEKSSRGKLQLKIPFQKI